MRTDAKFNIRLLQCGNCCVTMIASNSERLAKGDRMKGFYAREQATATDFVIVKGQGVDTYAWSAPRGAYAKWRNGWTQDGVKVELYKSWEHANAAIERYRKLGRVGFSDAKYCTFGEWKRLLRGESLD